MQAETSYPAIVGKIIENRRKAKNLRQAELAEKLGVTQSSWSRIERGQSGLSMEQLLKVSDILGTSPHEILADADYAKAGLESQGIRVHPNTVSKPERTMAMLGLAALGMMILTILSRK